MLSVAHTTLTKLRCMFIRMICMRLILHMVMEIGYLIPKIGIRDCLPGRFRELPITIDYNTSPANDGLNEGLNEGLKSLLGMIGKKPGVQAKDLPALLENRPLKTIERQISEWMTQRLIERRGSRKTGGYWTITKIMK